VIPLALKLAFRYFRTRRRSLARFTSAAAVVGIAAGVASLIAAGALARGFADEMREKILSNTPHISVSLKDGGEISDWREIAESLRGVELVEKVAPTTLANSILIGETSISYSSLIVKEGKPKTENRIEISLGRKLAEKTGARPGGRVELVTLKNQTEPLRSEVFVAETFETGIYDYDSTWIYASPEDFAALNGQNEFTPTVLSVSVRDIYRAPETAEKFKAILDGRFQIIDWQEANQPLFAALSLERKVTLAVIFLIVFIAALNITTTLALLVNERRLDIAVLRTCGAQGKTLIAIFLFEGLLTGAVGIFFGVGAGLLACSLGNRFRLVSPAEEVYSIGYVPFHVDFSSVLLIALAAFFVCLLGSLYPALRASRIKPLENLRAG
jgi:lipoprotein-releasing system permease protein